MGESVMERVVKAIVDSLAVDADEVVPQARLVEDLGADSLDVVQLALQLEEEFDLHIPDDEAKALPTVQAVADYIDRRCAERAQS